MFFARLAIAALTFGSFTQVLSAPIVVGVHPAQVDTTAGRIQNLPRDGPLNFFDALSKVDSAVQEANTIIDTPSVDTVQVSRALSKLDGALAGVAYVLDAPGSDVSSIFRDVDGVTTPATRDIAGALNTVETKVGEVVVKAASLKTVHLAVSEIESIKAKVVQIHSSIIKLIPEILTSLKSYLLHLMDMALESMGATIDA